MYADRVTLLERGQSADVHGEDDEEDHGEMLTWLGGDVDPTGFDGNTINGRLHCLC